MATDINDLLDSWAGAERAGDAGTLGRLLTDDFVGIGPVGFVLDKPGWLTRFDHGLRYDRLELDEITVRRHGDTTLVVAHQRAVGSHAGTPTPPDTRVSFTIVPEDEALRIAGMQYSFLGLPVDLMPSR
jgi:ketosteroid isomerase-like protein